MTRFRIWTYLLLALFVVNIAGIQAQTEPKTRIGSTPTPLHTLDLSGKPLSLEQYHSKVTLLDFWIIGCPGCTADLPVIASAYRKFHPQGFEAVGISLDDRHTKAELKAFLAKNQVTWRQAWDPKGWNSALIRPYGVESLPFTLLVGRDGKIRAVDVHGAELEAAVREALKGG